MASGYNYCSNLFRLLQEVMVVGDLTVMGREFGDVLGLPTAVYLVYSTLVTKGQQ